MVGQQSTMKPLKQSTISYQNQFRWPILIQRNLFEYSLMHRILTGRVLLWAFVSGAFRDSQLKWPTVEKEGFAIKETCHRCAHILQRPSGFDILTDHRNLMFLFNSEAAVADGRRQAADRIERWMVLLRAFNYRILHIPGCDNITADMLTQWAANRTTDDTQALDHSVSVAAIASTQLLQDSLRFDSVDIPTELELRQAQAAISQADRTSLSLNTNTDGLLVNKDDKILYQIQEHFDSISLLVHIKVLVAMRQWMSLWRGYVRGSGGLQWRRMYVQLSQLAPSVSK